MTPAADPPKLLDRLRHACRVRHYSLRTEDAYHDWCCPAASRCRRHRGPKGRFPQPSP